MGEVFAPYDKKSLIAHRGASGYAPEHTLEAYRLAIEQGAHYVEQDLQMSKEGVLVCLHDLSLERTTDVQEVFPDRYRDIQAGGETERHWVVADFSVEEIKQLDAGSWFDAKFAGARIPTWQEAIQEIRGKAGLFPEIKTPEIYREHGFDMEQAVVDELKRNGLDWPGSDSSTPVVLQSFSAESLRRMAEEQRNRLPRVLLLGEGDQAWLSPEELHRIEEFAGIGLDKNLLWANPDLVGWAHKAGLSVTAYTFRSSAVGEGFSDVAEEMTYYLHALDVDALFTDNPDQFPRR
jgi:glycerophosphoryl diester phosphodiesterase